MGKNLAEKRTVILRVAFVVSLLVAACLCGALSYKIIRQTEHKVGVETYDSVSETAITQARDNALQRLRGAEVTSAILEYAFPDAKEWPNVALNGYQHIAKKVTKLSQGRALGLIALVQPEELEDFEAHAQQVYADQQYPPKAGARQEFGFGVWRRNPQANYTDGKEPDTTGETLNFASNYSFLAPILEHVITTTPALLFNIHSEKFRAAALDSMMDCVEEFNTKKNTTDEQPQCWVVTEWLELNGFPGIKAGLIYLPIFPANDPSTVVGMIGTSLLWEMDVLKDIVPSYITGLTCVISTDTNSYTYVIQEGVAEFVGEGDLHDTSYDEYMKETPLTDFETGAHASAHYTLRVYPTEVMFQISQTNNALAVSLGFVGVILLCSALFFGYDRLMRYDRQQQKLILEIKRRFVRFISHEIRTPLNTVTMGLELLGSEITEEQNKDEAEDPIAKEDIGFWIDLIRDIRENTYNAIAVLNDLLQYDKIESNSLQLEYETVAIRELLDKTVNSFRIQAINKGIDMDLVWEDWPEGTAAPNGCKNDKAVVGDPVRLAQVFRNMISNALKFTPPEGSIVITASYRAQGLPNAAPSDNDGKNAKPELAKSNARFGSIMISVQDSGSGMFKAQLDQLFAEGVQFDANKLQAGSGSGLGLCIAKGIVEKHGGYIQATSPGLDLGSVFTVELPMYKIDMDELDVQKKQGNAEQENDASTMALSKESSTASIPTIRQKRILVAEDSESSRKMLIRLLERSGHACVAAANGRQAVDAALVDTVAQKEKKKHSPFDLILMDYEMPLMTGPEATLEIRKMGYTGAIFGVTGNVLREDVDCFLQSGADSVLAKPISMSMLNKHFDEHCQKQSQHPLFKRASADARAMSASVKELEHSGEFNM